jgi:hypothetical protein
MNNTIIQRFNLLMKGNLTLHFDKDLIINEKGMDALAEIENAGKKHPFKVILKNEIREMNLPGIAAIIQQEPEGWLLICQYIPDPIKKYLREHRINYLDAAGNCCIRRDQLFILINDQPVTPYRQPKEGKLWKPAGLKYLFAILQEPELLNGSYRHQIKAAKIAIGNIGPFQEQLKEEGYLREGKRDAKTILLLENKDQLRDKWVELFDAVLRPKLKQGTFRFIQNTRWEDILLDNAYWGGESAGAILTDYLQPEVYRLYTVRPKTDIMRELRLVPDPQGKVELMDLFWNETYFKNRDHQTVVPPLLAYAELITSLDSRNRETAERIKQKYLD